jgi:hypothetical protein
MTKGLSAIPWLSAMVDPLLKMLCRICRSLSAKRSFSVA